MGVSDRSRPSLPRSRVPSRVQTARMTTPSPTSASGRCARRADRRANRRPRHVAGVLLGLVGLVVGLVATGPVPAVAATPSDLVHVIIELDAPSSGAALTSAEHAALEDRRARTRAAASATGTAPQAVPPAGQTQREAAAVSRLQSSRVLVRAAAQQVLATAASRAMTVTNPHTSVDVLSAVYGEVRRADLPVLATLPGVLRVTPDVPMTAVDLPTGTPAGTGSSASATTPVPPSATPATSATSAPSAPSAGPAPGAGTVIAIVDTGIDYTLPDLGAGFGPGHVVVGGYDVVNDDADPMDDHYHGTHVAGIAAGRGPSVRGVAPGALLTAYKVLDANGNGSESTVIRGLEMAVDPLGANPADVVNMSLGGAGDENDPISRAVAGATALGAVVAVAAGNAGPGAQTLGSPGVAPAALTVGASTTDLRLATARLIGTTRDLPTWRVMFSANAPATPITARVIDVGAGTPADYRRVGDVRGAVVTYVGEAPRSSNDYPGSSFAQARLAEQHGAVAALARPQTGVEPGGGPVSVTEPGILPAVADSAGQRPLTSGDNGRLNRLVVLGVHASDYAALSAGLPPGTMRMRLTPIDATDQIAAFSSRGPTPSMAQKPDLVAPGVEIRSLVPRAQGVPGNAYRLSGTSMATPAVAGAAAVLRSHEPGLTGLQVRARLTGSAAPLAGDSRDLSTTVQGAGRLDLAAALHGRVTASPAVVSFGLPTDLGQNASRATVTLTNSSSQAVTATVDLTSAHGSVGRATVSPSSVRLAPGATTQVVVSARSAVGRVDTELSGEVVAHVSDGTLVRVPFLQVARTLLVRATPEQTTGATQLMVTSSVVLDSPPALTVRNTATGVTRTLIARPDTAMPGWYRADLSLPSVGSYAVETVGRRGAALMPGSTTVERVQPQRPGTWQRLGRAASAGDLAVSTAQPGVAIQATPGSARPFVTTDHGASWTQVRSLPVGNGFGTPIADPTDPQAFWYALEAAPGDPPLDPTYRGKVLRTTDLGRTWTVLPFPDDHIRAFLGRGNVLIAVVASGVRISVDGGASWTLRPMSWPEGITGAAITGSRLLVSGYSTVWGWDGFAAGLPGAPTTAVTGAAGLIALGASGRVATVAEFDGTVRVSTDSGAHWASSQLPDGDYAIGARVLGGEAFVAGPRGYWRSIDAGATWRLTAYPVQGPVGIDVERWPDRPRSLLMPLENAGLYASVDDGLTSTRIGVSSTTIRQVVTTRTPGGGSQVVIADEQGTDGLAMPAAGAVDETAWGPTGGEGMFGVAALDVAVDSLHPARWTRNRLDANNNAELQRSDDTGVTWRVVGPQTFGLSLSALVVDPADGRHAVVGFTQSSDRGLLVTDDDWATWHVYSHDVTVREVTLDPSRPGRMWVAADEGLFRSDDTGRTLTPVLTGEALSVWVDPARPATVVVGGLRIRVSTDGGATFRTADTGGGDTLFSSFATASIRLPGASTPTRVLFAGSAALRPYGWRIAGRGVLCSIDNGRTWTSVSGGLESTSVTSMSVTPDGTWLVVGTTEGGVHRAAVADLLG